MGHVSSWQRRSKRTAHLSTEDESTLISEKPYYGYKKDPRKKPVVKIRERKKEQLNSVNNIA